MTKSNSSRAVGSARPSAAQRTVFLELDGEQVRPRDAQWIVYNPAGVPVHFFASDITIGDDVSSAARTHWMGSTPALWALNAGYRLELMSQKRFISEIARNLRDDDTPPIQMSSRVSRLAHRSGATS